MAGWTSIHAALRWSFSQEFVVMLISTHVGLPADDAIGDAMPGRVLPCQCKTAASMSSVTTG